MYFCKKVATMRRIECFMLSILSLTLISCINQDYDLEQINIGTLAGLKGITLPIGSTEKFYLDDYLNDDLTGGMLKSDALGNYYFSISGQAQSDGLSVPDFHFEGLEPNTERTYSEYALRIENLAQNRDYVTEVIEFADISYSIVFYQTDLPKDIKDISYADVDAEFVVDFSFDRSHLPFECIWIAAGTRIILPEFMIPGNLPDVLKMDEANVVVFRHDFPIKESGSSLIVPVDALDLAKLPEGQGIVSPGTVSIEQEAVISGGFYLKFADCLSEGVFTPEFNSTLTVGAIDIQSVTAALDIDESSLSVAQQLEVKDIPEFLDNDDFHLDFNKLRLNLTLINDSPFSGSLNASVATGRDSETFWSADLSGLTFASYATSCFSLSEDGTGAPDGYQDMAVDGLNSIMSQIPETISLNSGLDIADEYLDITPGSEFSFGVEYGFDVPMAFGENLSISLTEDIVDMNVEVAGVAVPKAVVSFNFVNAIPLGLELQAVPIDADGRELTHIHAEMNQGVKAGSADSPAITPIEIALTCQDRLAFDGLRLRIALSSSSDGGALNSNQYIQITDLSVCLPEGITYYQ